MDNYNYFGTISREQDPFFEDINGEILNAFRSKVRKDLKKRRAMLNYYNPKDKYDII